MESLPIALSVVVVLVPIAMCWYLRLRLMDYRKGGDQRPLGPLEGLRPDQYTVDGYHLLHRYWVWIIISLICALLVVGVLHP